MNNKLKLLISVSLILVVLVVSAALVGCGEKSPTGKVSFQLNTMAQGSTAYGMMTIVAQYLQKYEPDIDMFVSPCDTLYLTYRLAEKGEGNAIYSGAYNMAYAYAGRGPYADEPVTVDVYHLFYYGSADQFLCTLADRDDINGLADLEGKKVYAGNRGSTREVIEDALTAIGVNAEIVDIDRSAATDALERGVIDATLGWTSNFGRSLVPWFAEVDARAKIKILQPTDAEWNMMLNSRYAEEGMMFLELPTTAFTQELNVDTLRVYSVMPGFFAMPELPEDTEYRFIKLLFEQKDALAADSAKFSLFAEEPGPTQEKGISGAPGIAVAPGVAKYYKEIGIWNSDWKVGKYESRETKTLKIG